MAAPGQSKRWWQLLATAALVGSATMVGFAIREHVAAPDVVMLFLLAIVFAASRFDRVAALLASTLSVLAYNFFFVPPVHTLAVAEARHLLTFATMFLVGLLVSTLTARTVRLAESARTAELAAKTEQLRSSLLSAVSHDLRTPLGAITGAATTLRDGTTLIDAAQRAELIETVCEEAERLEHFVANLLEMTRLQAGALQVRREWVPLEELIGSALTRLEARLEARPVRVMLPPELPLLWVDPVLLEQVFFNVLENATKHTPEGAALEISAGVEHDQVRISFADAGPGIPQGMEERLFEMFFRGPQSARTQGSGLGLAVCRGIVEAHGGRIFAQRRSGGGAVFVIQVALAPNAPLVPAEPASSPEEA